MSVGVETVFSFSRVSGMRLDIGSSSPVTFLSMRLDPDRSEVLEVASPLSPARRALRIDVEGVDRSVEAIRSRFRFSPPKQRLAQRSGNRMRPISLPSG